MSTPTLVRRTIVGAAILVLVGALVGLAVRGRHGTPAAALSAASVPEPRIVSLAPSTTETLFALGLGDHVVGVSRFCDFPPAVTNLARVGGLTDVDIEAIVRLRPDVVVAPGSQLRARDTLAKLGIDVLAVDQETLPQIIDSVWIIGEALGRADVATAWLGEMDAVLATAKANAPASNACPRVLVCVGRDPVSFERIYIAGKGTFYNDVLDAVGGRNAYEGNTPYPMVAAEGVLLMNPDIIVDIVPAVDGAPRLDAAAAAAQWKTIPGVRAAAENRVHVITESWAVRPGPRVGFLVERFAKIVQPQPQP